MNPKYKGYEAICEVDFGTKEIVGHVPDIEAELVFTAKTPEELITAFHETVDDYLEWCAEDGREPSKPYSGKLSLRLTPELHRKAALEARRRGASLNAFINQTLEAALAPVPPRMSNRPAGGAVLDKRLAAADVDGLSDGPRCVAAGTTATATA